MAAQACQCVMELHQQLQQHADNVEDGLLGSCTWQWQPSPKISFSKDMLQQQRQQRTASALLVNFDGSLCLHKLPLELHGET